MEKIAGHSRIKGKGIPIQDCGGIKFEFSTFLRIRLRQVVRLAGLLTGRLYTQEISLVFIAVKRPS